MRSGDQFSTEIHGSSKHNIVKQIIYSTIIIGWVKCCGGHVIPLVRDKSVEL